MWIVRDKHGFVILFAFEKPNRDKINGIWVCSDNKCCEIPDNKRFKNLKWEDDPIEIDLEKLLFKADGYDEFYYKTFGWDKHLD